LREGTGVDGTCDSGLSIFLWRLADVPRTAMVDALFERFTVEQFKELN